MVNACHKCRLNGVGETIRRIVGDGCDERVASACNVIIGHCSSRCAECRRVSQDDINIERTAKNENPELAKATTNAPSERLTGLPTEVEDTLLRLICTITAMDPLNVLLVLHVARGGSPAGFGPFVNKVVADARTYGPSIGRATAKAKWTAITKTFRPFAALRSWGIGHAWKQRGDEGPRMRQGELF